MRRILKFYLGETLHELSSCSPTLSLLDWLRLDQGLRGTKEGCNEGDCGACTVLVGRLEHGKLTYRALNACILFLPTLDGCQIYTIEHLKQSGALHPLQQAMVDHHASQCGFCTPGIIMSLLALWLNESAPPTISRIEDVLAGNLCRCTGYRPIIDAALALYATARRDTDPFLADAPRIAQRLQAMQDDETLCLDSPGTYYAPATLSALADLYAANPDATLVAGMTDVALWVTKELKDLPKLIALNRIEELKQHAKNPDGLSFGAMVPLTQIHQYLGAQHPQIAELLRRFGSQQVRNSGTIGGNIANGSPIGDLPPLLIALGASLTLRRASATRTIPLEAFFLDYKKQDRAAGEFVERIDIPRLSPDELFHVSKISKRSDEDISAVCAAFWLKRENGIITKARLAFGGMAATPKRASHAEAALIGQTWSPASAEAAAEALTQDFTPLSDWRASAAYRAKTAANLLRRFALESSSAAPIRLATPAQHHV